MERDDIERYAQYGRASLIPGIQKSIQFLQEMLDDLRMQLAAAEGEQISGRKVKVKRKVMDGRGGWSADPEERKAEMARRLEARKPIKKKRVLSLNHPNHPDHPKHAAWVKKTVKARIAGKRAAKLAKAA